MNIGDIYTYILTALLWIVILLFESMIAETSHIFYKIEILVKPYYSHVIQCVEYKNI